ncbi:hypothetical protein GOFOIKOB_4515 [Methylobacterium tardum]|uniref:Uncharacterized protein n=1 Tax=Methylobacterium tardum TaxID=374432 RepID=A0AA37WVY1_9HYPH|nr:hypothetical protein [Methylobacterium tardum]URD39458.1 hypothetical protein M6G65_14235 [Methylobacterium tardum]GJE51456.1 hypothetical protein GOFOIKOB_4515 [Methylobacterium tardum]GLS73647.1 hypothetical protein GCM10007890_56620 [Methylobacterium tardum]
MTPEAVAVLAAAAALVEGRRRYLGLLADRPLPSTWEAALEQALAALRAAEEQGS